MRTVPNFSRVGVVPVSSGADYCRWISDISVADSMRVWSMGAARENLVVKQGMARRRNDQGHFIRAEVAA